MQLSRLRGEKAMPMQMGFRWYGEDNDKISLS